VQPIPVLVIKEGGTIRRYSARVPYCIPIKKEEAFVTFKGHEKKIKAKYMVLGGC
jgi:hypothetical protein